MIDLKRIAQGLVFLHGLSGAGKGVLKAQMEEAANKDGVKVFYLASGDCFRAIAKKVAKYRAEGNEDKLTPEEIETGNLMAEGRQIRGLQGIAEPVIEVMMNYIDAISRGEKAIIIFDGILRNGEDSFQDEGMTTSQRLPSQILQVAEMLNRGMKRYFLNEDGTPKEETILLIQQGIVDYNFINELNGRVENDLRTLRDEGDVAGVAQSIRHDSSHAIVDVEDADAELLMRLRSKLVIYDLLIKLSLKEDRTDQLDLIQGDLLDLYKLQSGRFEIKNGQVELLDITAPDLVMESYGLDREKAKIVDTKLGEISNNLLTHLGSSLFTKTGEKKQIKEAITEIKANFGLKDEDVPRYDDLPHISRLNRIGDYKNNALPRVIEGELGVKIKYDENDPKNVELDYTNSRVNPEKTRIIGNGPKRKIGLKEYKEKALTLSIGLYEGAIGKEGNRIFGGVERGAY